MSFCTTEGNRDAHLVNLIFKKMRRPKLVRACQRSPVRLPAPAPTASPSAAPAASPPASPANEPDDQQEYQSANGGVDDRRDNASAKVDAELRQQPPADEGSYDADNEVTDEPEPGALHDLAGEPSGNQ